MAPAAAAALAVAAALPLAHAAPAAVAAAAPSGSLWHQLSVQLRSKFEE